MHLLRTTTRLIEEAEAAVDLGQSPGDIVFLSFSDSDLGVVAAALENETPASPRARLASLAMLRHPYSVDLYIDKVAAKARFVLVRLLGGLDYWRYGALELAAAARRGGFDLAIVPGDGRPDPRLAELSTLAAEETEAIWRAFEAGGLGNIARLFGWIGRRIGGDAAPPPAPERVPAYGLYAAACRPGTPDQALAAIVFYRAYLLAGDLAPIVALADALAARGARVLAAYAPSLKDAEAAAWLADLLRREQPDVVVNSTAFAARMERETSPLEAADAPIIQAIHAGASRAAWARDPRGLVGADLAMNVVLPELDGRIIARTISFKDEAPRSEALQFSRLVHQPEPSRVAFVAELALAWARLRRLPRGERRLACIVSDYPAKAGRAGYAVGLDTPASLAAIAARLKAEGYSIEAIADADEFFRTLAVAPLNEQFALADYEAEFARLPPAFRESVAAAWGEPERDLDCRDGGFHFRVAQLGAMIVALQPDRGGRAARKSEYHDPRLPPRHGYVAFYLWLRRQRIDAMIQLGAHGTLEWLPGKAVALSEDCAPEALLGPTPLIYPFIVNNPGEAAQAKRRAGAVIVSHLTPPLAEAGASGPLLEFESLFDEYAAAQQMDAKRAALLAKTILERAAETGLAAESGAAADASDEDRLARLDAWLCDIKEMRIADGLHIFGSAPSGDVLAGAEADDAARARLAACPESEMAGLLAALDGRFVPPGAAGAPGRGRLDVLPTGRNLFTIDPRTIPTRTAWTIGQRAAEALVARHLQDHGDWPRRLVVDLWGSATMRTGGEELAQIFAYLGATPVWDHGSGRVTGFTILPSAALPRPRIDVTLRLSGLFRDVFPAQIALLEQLIGAVAGLDEPAEFNPLAAARAMGESPLRLFGPAPGAYGAEIGRLLADDPDADVQTLAEAYLTASGYALGAADREARDLFRARVAEADVYVHIQDLPGQDALEASAFFEHEGGFAAAAKSLGGKASLYHLDATRSERPAVRTLREEIARAVRGRAANPRWIAGQMRHGYRGGGEIAETVDNLYGFAVSSGAVTPQLFDLVFEATLGDDAVAAFLAEANPQAARAIAARFDQALRRGLWTCRRNSTAMRLAAFLERAA
ncbi:MAG TPA: cobaltochelatase subunit CobN [Roseiarcus sp.]|nr:cobaltochelatase subunit CobN [Roseiarcus sp.]